MADAYLTIPPNWAEPVSLSHVWRTSILRGETGDEQRSALYTKARRKIRYRLDVLDAAEMRWIKRHLFKYLHQVWGVPLWPDRTYLTAQADAGQNVLTVASAAYRHFGEGERVILLDAADPGLYEAGEIASISAPNITLVNNLANTWPVGTDVYPMIEARLNPAQEMSLYVPAYGGLDIEAEETIG